MRSDVIVRLHAANKSVPQMSLRLTSTRFVEAEITADHVFALAVWFGVGAVVTTYAWMVFSAWLAGGIAIMLVVAPLAFVLARSGRRSTHIAALLPDVVDMLGRSLRSGASLRGALAEVAVDAPPVIQAELRPVVDALARGQSSAEALWDWVRRSPMPEIRVVAAALSLACDHESGTTQALEGVSQSLRDRATLASEIRALTAQATVSMQALVVLPAGFLLIDATGNQEVLRFLLYERIGQLCLASGVTLNLLGWFWMRALIRKRLPA